jgi:hypothetical protein
MKKFNLLYKGRKIYTDLSYEDCVEIIDEFSQKFFQGEDIDPNEIILEEIGV